MSKHTSGPWAYSEQFDGDGESLGLEVVANRAAVTRLPGIGLEDYANAQLIAAAPDLLAVLEHVLDRATMPGFLRDKVKAAIDSAIGGAK